MHVRLNNCWLQLVERDVILAELSIANSMDLMRVSSYYSVHITHAAMEIRTYTCIIIGFSAAMIIILWKKK